MFRLILIVLLLVHGLIHVLGPVTYWRLAELLLDERTGPPQRAGPQRRPTPEQLVLTFDRPQSVGRLVCEEETERERTQEVHVEVSAAGGRSYRCVLVQEYTFSRAGRPSSTRIFASNCTT